MSERSHGPRAVSEPTATATHSYRVKHHTSQARGRGPRRVVNPTSDPELAGMDDDALIARNVQLWADVLAGCTRAAGLDPSREYSLVRRDPESVLATAAHVAALRVCRHRFGIPVARLAEISGRSRGWVSVVIEHTWHSDRVAEGLIASWDAPPDLAAHLAPAPVEISSDAAAALASMSDRLGVPSFVLASAAVLACAELFRNPKQSA